MFFYCNFEVDGKLCYFYFDSWWKFKEYLVLVFYCGMKVVCFFCIIKEVIFSWLVDFKNYVLRRYKEVIVFINIFIDDFFLENNCFWIFCWFVIYRFLVELIDRNFRVLSKLRILIFDWIKKIMFMLKRLR